ncbi:MAG: carbohydrate-binding family 9-like protein [Pseudomonadota bacterium]
MTGAKEYRVHRTGGTRAVELNWDSYPWQTVEPGVLSHFMGHRPDHFPETAFKAVFDATRLHLLFMVRDRFVVARRTRYQDQVCDDSCVEFFFYPGDSTGSGYFNLEINCCGAFLFRFQKARDTDVVAVSSMDASLVRIVTSLGPGRIDPEIQVPLTWSVLVSLPFSVIGRYVPLVEDPVVWRANMYKCADRSSHPHWLTWSPVPGPGPDFHRSGSFGRFVFEQD